MIELERQGAVLDGDEVNTLDGWLDAQARWRGDAVCLRAKTLGRWHDWTWRRADEVVRVAAALEGRGFARGDVLVVADEPRVEALFILFAALRLGGLVCLTSREGRLGETRVPSTGPSKRFVFDRGFFGDHGALHVSYEDLASSEVSPPAAARVARDAGDAAFVFPSDLEGIEGHPPSTHREALAAGRSLFRFGLHPGLDALAPRALSPEIAGALLGAWVSAGFCLHVPETPATRDLDRRELAPSVVVGTAASYARLRQRVLDNLPPPGSIERHLIDWALVPSPRGGEGALRRYAGELLVRRPLRKVVGLSRVKLPLVEGEGPEEPVRAFYARLGLDLVPLAGASRGWRVESRAGGERPTSVPSPVAEDAS